MGCFVRGGKSLWDVLSGVAKNGMGCFVPGCFVRLPFFLPLFKNIINVCVLNLAGDINSSNLLVRYELLNFRILESELYSNGRVMTSRPTTLPTIYEEVGHLAEHMFTDGKVHKSNLSSRSVSQYCKRYKT